MKSRKFFIPAIFLIEIFTAGFAPSFLWGQTLYKKSVTASYYAEDFNGKKTSNGETFNMNALTCAHKTLPFNTVLKVTNLSNKKTVEVRVNDRGPFVAGREIDLSKAAAVKLGMIGTGTAKVKLEILKLGAKTKLSNQTAASAVKIMAGKGEKISTWLPEMKKEKLSSDTSCTKSAGISVSSDTGSPKTTDSKSSSDTNSSKSTGTSLSSVTDSSKTISGKSSSVPNCTKYDIQLGAFSTRENANKKAQALLKAGFKNVVFRKSKDIIRVVIKDVDESKISETESLLKEKGFDEYTIKKTK